MLYHNNTASVVSSFLALSSFRIARIAIRYFLLQLLLPIVLVCVLPYHQCHGLSSIAVPPPPTSIPSKPIQRIAIIGCGISGLSVAHALLATTSNNLTTGTCCGDSDSYNSYNNYETIDLFDARTLDNIYDSPNSTATTVSASLGAGIQLNGGLSILHKIHPKLQEAVSNAGCDQIQIESRTNPWDNDNINAANSNNIDSRPQHSPYDTLLQLDLQKTIESSKNENAMKALLLLSQQDDPMDDTTTTTPTTRTRTRLLWISIMRGALQRVLYEQLLHLYNNDEHRQPLPSTTTTTPPNHSPNTKLWNAYFEKKLLNIRSLSTISSTSNVTTNKASNDDSMTNNTNNSIATTTTVTELYCQFEDGTEYGPYDIIIGCDGINSVCKQYIDGSSSNRKYDQPNNNECTKIKKKKLAIYSGLRIRYAVADSDDDYDDDDDVSQIDQHNTRRRRRTSKLTQYFGNGAYALHGTYGNGINQPAKQCTFIVYLDKDYIGPFPRNNTKNDSGKKLIISKNTTDENVDWRNDEHRTIDKSRQEMLQQLVEYQIPGTDDDVLRQTVRKANVFFELGSYYHNPFGSWSCTVEPAKSLSSPTSSTTNHPAYVVLCGDAAHALPPFLGQGSNQAIQDAYCLVQKVLAYNTQIYDTKRNDTNIVTLPILLQQYENTRWFPCFDVFLKAAFLGYLETGGTNGFYSKFRDVFFKSMGILGVAALVLIKAATPKV